ncbi:DUF87 domain-containing protein [Pedobacter sp.]|uniref:helicase HerA domain-containing protein n=1 Tax=Pedobacter sp. TaxID=1411316 RepID=UPI0031CE35A3
MLLNIKQRFAVVAVYTLLILLIGYYFTNSWKFVLDTSSDLNILLIATGLALVLSTYITEPFFSKPVDVITRWVAIFLFMLGLDSRHCISLYNYWVYASVFFIVIALLMIFLHGNIKFERQQRAIVSMICTLSRPEFVFTILYFNIVISLFRFNQIEYPILIGFGFLLAINKPIVWLVQYITKLITSLNATGSKIYYLGQVIGHESTDLYKVEVEIDNEHRQHNLKGKLVYLENVKKGTVGIVINERILLGKKWLDILSLRDSQQNLISFSIASLMPLSGERSIYSKSNAVYLFNLESINLQLREIIENNSTYSNFNSLVGTVWEGSTINKIRFNKLFSDQLQIERGIGEGSIIETKIANESVLFQIIDARTNEESLEFKDTYGFTIGTAQKLGQYDVELKELNTVKWLPEIYNPAFLLDPSQLEYNSADFIGRLPNTNYGIPIRNPHELVTHNTAVLGILGIGKSCLTFELLQKLLNSTDVKVFCIDLTNQYAKALPSYITAELIQQEFSNDAIKKLKDNNVDTGHVDYPDSWGNLKLYEDIIKGEIETFVGSEKRILILNPDMHNVSKAAPGFKVTSKIDLTPAEKTRLISERLIRHAASLGETADARFLLVLEEAHSLVPEWNSISNEGDKNATNGTAKVILQGRKYGLGTLVITQRTANISKSILNQCNTIFAMRIFDDTGKQFLENYIGSDYSNLLPTLEERHCIAIGKSMKLKQPVILQLNDMNDIILPKT